MFDPPARRLAVATLTEAGNGAPAFRGPGGQPLQGYVLMTGEGTDCRVTVYLQHGQGGHTAILAGEMVWFQTQAEAPPAEVPVPSMHAAGGAAEPWAGLLAGAGGPAVASSEGAESEPSPEPEPAPEPEEAVEPVESAEPEGPVETGFKLYHEPAKPVAAFPPHKIEVTVTPVEEPAAAPASKAPPPDAARPETTAVPMASRHPMAPRAGGTARLDFGEGRLTLTLRGLPSPGMLGKSLNAYRAWLLNQRAGTREPLGLLTRVWGENFRLETDPGLPLSRYDAVLITAGDRQSEQLPTDAPQVLLGTYSSAR